MPDVTLHSGSRIPWHASGLLFENCSCQVICPGHMHFSSRCTEARCLGYWAIRVDEGAYGEVDLAGSRVVIAYDAPQLMIEGGWRERIVIDESADADRRAALESILDGSAGGPWAKLDEFVGERLPTRYASIDLDDRERIKQVAVDGVLSGSIETIRGRDRDRPVTLENVFNQIHAPEQVVASGSSTYDDGAISFVNEGTHGLWSAFSWRVEAR
jgi:hypothetical protein